MPTYLGVGSGGGLLNDDWRLLFLYERGKILHLFKLLRPALSRETDLRDRLGRVRVEKGKDYESLDRYEEIVKEMDARMQRDAEEAKDRPIEELITVNTSTGFKVLPHWLAQPYVRPLPVANGEKAEEVATKGVFIFG